MDPFFISQKRKDTMGQTADLRLCNLVSQGKTLKEAKAIVAEADKKREGRKKQKSQEGGSKPTTKEKKELLKAEIEALGVEAPAMNESVAKFEEALTAAKAAKETEGSDSSEDSDSAENLM